MKGIKPLLIFLSLLVISHTVSGAELTVKVENYDGKVNLTIQNANFSINRTFSHETTIELPEGVYFAYLSAMNLTFVKKVNVSDNITLSFNLAFTSSPDVLSISYHTVIYPGQGFEVTEVVMIRNNAGVNFRGNLTVPLPDCRNLRVVSSSLSYLSYIPMKDITFTDLLVAEKSEGQITLQYTLEKNRFERKVENASVLIMTTAKVNDFSPNLEDEGMRSFSGKSFRVLAGKVSGDYYVELEAEETFNLNPLALAGIALVAGSVFLALYERKGGWKI